MIKTETVMILTNYNINYRMLNYFVSPSSDSILHFLHFFPSR